MKEKILMAWSGGKDSAMALRELMLSDKYEIVALLTTFTKEYGRISMHGVREELAEEQARAIGIPLEKVYITVDSTLEDYESAMKEVLEKYRSRGVSLVAFGDIFLEDLRKHREEKLAIIGMCGLFPLWKRNTSQLAQQFIELGFKAITTCVDSKVLDGSFVGRQIDQAFLSGLSLSVDPCGENGEFHSFVFKGPIFANDIAIKVGEKVFKDERFCFCDILKDDTI